MYTIYSKMCSLLRDASLFFNAPNMLVTLYPFFSKLAKSFGQK